MSYWTFASEAWAAYKVGRACPEVFIAWAADKFYENGQHSGRNYSYPDCKIMARGFYLGVTLTNAGEMKFKALWKEFCSNPDFTPA